MPGYGLAGQEIFRRRIDRNMTQAELAARAGVSARHISEIERDKVSPRLDTMAKISVALGSYFTWSIVKRGSERDTHRWG